MPKVVYFEIPAKDSEKIIEFYSNVFGWKIKSWEQKYWPIDFGEEKEDGIDGAIYLSEKMTTVMNTINVPDIDECVERIKNSGGKIIVEPESEKWGWHGYFKDPEGTVMGIVGPKK